MRLLLLLYFTLFHRSLVCSFAHSQRGAPISVSVCVCVCAFMKSTVCWFSVKAAVNASSNSLITVYLALHIHCIFMRVFVLISK